MDSSNVIAAAALVISTISVWISYLAYRYSVRAKNAELRLAFAREKSEFLVRIDKARKTFDSLEHRLKQQLSRIENAPHDVRLALAAQVNKVASDLKYLEGCQRQAWSLWHEVYEMSQSGLAHHGPRFLGLIEGDEEFALGASQRCDSIESTIGVHLPGHSTRSV